MKKIIEVKNLTKKYGHFTAVDDISFSVEKGEIFGLLGENGAGKTTTLEIIEGLRQATSGKVTVLGLDVQHSLAKIKEKIGVQLQSSAYFNYLNLKEILDLFASFYSQSLNTNELLKMVGLEEKSQSFIANLSGGQKQRFSIIASLINNPEIIFLDEPTTGLDPLARRKLWELIADIKKQGKTIVLTTHYMEEAELLCDRVAIMESGRIIAMGAVHQLIEKTQYPFKIHLLADRLSADLLFKLSKIAVITNLAGKTKAYQLTVKNQADLNGVLKLLAPINPQSITINKASLEDLFIELTGKIITES